MNFWRNVVIYQLENKYSFAIFEEKQKNISVTRLDGVKGFSVSKTFDCGQSFRFEPVIGSAHEEEFAGVALGRFFSVARDGETVYIYNCDKAFFEDKLCAYLGLDMDYEEIREDIITRCGTPYMRDAAEKGDGIRILAQEKWEALCSFIISQNNNIPRIKKIIRALSEKCGEAVAVSGMEPHGACSAEFAFPSPSAVMSLGVEGLRELRVGFRASYIFDAAKKVVEGEIDLDSVALLPTDECLSELCKIKGVGFKVASCTALFGMGKYDSFPIDVWIRRVLAEKFPPDFDPLTLGRYAGIAQQYMFYAARFD